MGTVKSEKPERGATDNAVVVAEKKGISRRIPQGLAVMIVALALLTLVLMIILIAATQNRDQTPTDTETTTSSEATATVESIDVVAATDYMTENASEGGSADDAEVAVPEDESDEAQDLLADTRLTGVDEDVAITRAKAAGFTAYSVYVFKTDTITGSAAAPTAGTVLKWAPFFGRAAGEQFAFFYTQTTEPTKNAVAVPSVFGMDWKVARDTLTKAGLNVRFEYEQNSPDPYGSVVFQAPASGTYMPAGSSVVIVLAD